MATQHTIVQGPSKHDLMLSLFERKFVSFTIATTDGKTQILDRVLGDLVSKGTDKHDCIKGKCIKDEWEFEAFSCKECGDAWYKGIYSTQTRKGTIEVDDPDTCPY